MTPTLTDYAFTERFRFLAQEAQKQSSYELIPARVLAVHRELYHIVSDNGEQNARVSGSYMKWSGVSADYPTAGDYVMIKYNSQGDSTIVTLLDRATVFTRAGFTAGAVEAIAANFDYIFIVSSLNADLKVRRLERYLAAAWQSGATPVVLLTKSDLCADRTIIEQVELTLAGVDVHAISAVTGENLQSIEKYFTRGKTSVFMGMSGVGKSTLVNALYGEEIMITRDIREDDAKGRHTTTHRQLILLSNGAMIIDTPGMRSLSTNDVEDGLDSTFGDITELMLKCKYSDCSHKNETGCAVQDAIKSGILERGRYDSYVKLKKGQQHEESKHSLKLRMERQRNSKNIAKHLREHYRDE